MLNDDENYSLLCLEDENPKAKFSGIDSFESRKQVDRSW